MQTINYLANFNNKLDCDAYTSIRLPDPLKYVIGNSFRVTLKDKDHHVARLVEMKELTLDRITPFIAYLDTGKSIQDCIQIIMKSYNGQGLDFSTQPFVFMLFEKQKAHTSDKIALFCLYYERYTGVKYRPTRKEVGQIREVQVTDDRLQAYFECREWWAKTKSIAFYVRNINDINLLVSGKVSKHPNKWDESYFNKLSGREVGEYYAHLRSLGLKPQYGRLNQIIGWE